MQTGGISYFPWHRSQIEGTIGVRANIHLGGQTEFCPNAFSGGGVESRNSVGWQNFFR